MGDNPIQIRRRKISIGDHIFITNLVIRFDELAQCVNENVSRILAHRVVKDGLSKQFAINRFLQV